MFPDTSEIEEGEKGQFELFQSGVSFMKAGHGKFFDLTLSIGSPVKRTVM